jgi:hypothetical protein
MRPFSIRSSFVVLVVTLALALATAGSAMGSPSDLHIYLSKISLSGCNELHFGYVIGSTQHELGNNSSALCGNVAFAKTDFSVPSGSTFSDVKLYLSDVSCDAIYYDDGTGSADHAVVGTGSKHRTVDIADAGGTCENEGSTVSPARGAGNLSLVEALH